jgi:hypothetical protein
VRDTVDDGVDAPESLSVGKVDLREDAPSSWEGIRAVLWLPDPEQRHFWREFYVRDKPPAKPGGKLGF